MTPELPAVTRNLTKVATYWAPGSNDGQGGVRMSPPVSINCRWEAKTRLVRNAQGKEVVSDTTVYVDRVLKVQGMLAYGVWTDTPQQAKAREILSVDAAPSIRSTKQLNKVYL